MKQNLLKSLRVFWVVCADMYAAAFALWFALSMLTDGRIAWVNLANMFAFQLFLPLILCGLAGFVYRIRRLQIAGAAALVLFAALFGKFLLPKEPHFPRPAGTLKVMTYNMLSYSLEPSAVVEVICEEDADIVFMQETNPQTAEALQSGLKEAYPYQIHDPRPKPTGMSVISKFPFERLNWKLEEKSVWVGKPILLEVEWNGRRINIVNFHMVPTPAPAIAKPGIFNLISETRKDEARLLIEFLQKFPGPAVLAGDMNDVFLNDPYRMMTGAGLQDAWTEAGFGLGHTFPGNKSPGTSRMHIGDLYVPEWMVRIDYIFATPEWEILSAHIARTDGYSDHRPVAAILRLK